MPLTYREVPIDSGEPITLSVTFTAKEWAESQEKAREEEARIQVEMDACPHTACTCGWHCEG